jgi:hypothetical protein
MEQENLMSTAQTQTNNNAHYRAAIYRFNIAPAAQSQARRRHQAGRPHAAGGDVLRYRGRRRKRAGIRGEGLVLCSTIKSRDIRIVVLYTTHLPLPTNAWYTYISSFQRNIGTNLRNCASPGLYLQVSVEQDISAAIIALFDLAVTTAHLTSLPGGQYRNQ